MESMARKQILTVKCSQKWGRQRLGAGRSNTAEVTKMIERAESKEVPLIQTTKFHQHNTNSRNFKESFRNKRKQVKDITIQNTTEKWEDKRIISS
jgi:hypothetical protein